MGWGGCWGRGHQKLQHELQHCKMIPRDLFQVHQTQQQEETNTLKRHHSHNTGTEEPLHHMTSTATSQKHHISQHACGDASSIFQVSRLAYFSVFEIRRLIGFPSMTRNVFVIDVCC